MLPDERGAQEATLDEDVMCGLKHTLQVRGIALRERKLAGELVEGDAPGEPAIGASDLEQAVQPPCHG